MFLKAFIIFKTRYLNKNFEANFLEQIIVRPNFLKHITSFSEYFYVKRNWDYYGGVHLVTVSVQKAIAINWMRGSSCIKSHINFKSYLKLIKHIIEPDKYFLFNALVCLKSTTLLHQKLKLCVHCLMENALVLFLT